MTLNLAVPDQIMMSGEQITPAMRTWMQLITRALADVTGGAGTLTIEDEGTPVGTAGGITTIDFVGAGVTATGSGADATVTISGGGSGSLTIEEEGAAVGTPGGITTIDFVGSAVTATGSGADATVTITASSLPVVDTTNIVKGSSDATKLMRFEVDGLTTATTRVLTIQDYDIIVAGLNIQQAFTKNQRTTPVALSDGATISVDASLSNNFYVTLGGNRTLANPTNLSDGMILCFVLKQDGTGSRVITWGSKYKFPSDLTPTLSSGANDIDFMSAYYDAAGDILICVINKDFV